ncbi:MAG: hypothetical protein VX111_06345 [Planctomycetota bacterium]|nr:hypothetical protein [Planctomycetota bacterium]
MRYVIGSLWLLATVIASSPCVIAAHAFEIRILETRVATQEDEAAVSRVASSEIRPLGKPQSLLSVVASSSSQFEAVSKYSGSGPIESQEDKGPVAKQPFAKEIADVPKPITSFGAAIIGDQVYAYGGHFGNAHEYSTEGQSNELIQLNLQEPGRWKVLSRGPKLQGLAMVTDGEKLYRLGGFTAKNQPGDEHDLWSQDQVASFDLESKKWSELPKLPEPRSSFDAVMLGHVIYVVGGWQMAGEADTRWHETAWSLDLSSTPLVWKPLAKPPFKRRAVGAAAFAGKIYVIGGMEQKGEPTTSVAIYDPKRDIWSEGPAIPGEGLEGFGSAAFAQDGRLFVSTLGGNLLRLSEDGKTWEKAQKLETARFFHRMLPVGKQQMVFFGGTNMEIGKFDHVDLIDVR